MVYTIRMTKKSFFPVTVKIIFMNNSKTKTLIACYPQAHYGVVGGHLNEGEEIIDAALREAFEETGMRLLADQLQPYTFAKHRQGKIILMYTCLLAENIQLQAHDDVEDLLWVDVTDIANDKYPVNDYKIPILEFANTN